MDHTLNQFCCDGLKSVSVSFLLNQCQVYQYKCRSLVKARRLLAPKVSKLAGTFIHLHGSLLFEELLLDITIMYSIPVIIYFIVRIQ